MLCMKNIKKYNMSFIANKLFEGKVSEWFGAPYGVAVDCCTHGLELALRLNKSKSIISPKHTYVSVPMLADKLNIGLSWKDEMWEDYYYLTPNIIDAAVYWKKNSYIKGTFMVLSFQHKKHLSLGRGGMILTDNKEAASKLRSMAYDGRVKFSSPWAEQDITEIGYHYYMTPETAMKGLEDLEDAIVREPKKWSYKNYPNLNKFKVFNNG